MMNLQKNQLLHLIIIITQIFLIVFITSSSICSCSYYDDEYDPTSSTRHLKRYDNLFRVLASSRGIAPAASVSAYASPSRRHHVTVDHFGAKANGRDDTRAFKKAWNVACATKNSVLIVPKHKVYHVRPITFKGPCKSTTTIKVYGTIKASVRSSAYKKDRRHWLLFKNVRNLRVSGGGTIIGNGQIWWSKSCKINKKLPCQEAPTAVTFYGCKNLKVANIAIKNAQQMHLTFQNCVNVKAVNLVVKSPEKSPNTDGIHVTHTQNIVIEKCAIKTGDDCISIVSGSKNVRATDITCGPGHGISIGSLGAGDSEAHVSNVYVNRAKLSGSTNGVRIKTWQGGSGYVRNVVFEDIMMKNVTNPIIIDQHYCDKISPCQEEGSAVQVSNVQYKNIKGTSASEVAMKFDCSKRFPCHGILLQNINLRLEKGKHEKAKASCSNIKFHNRGKIFPSCS